MSVGDKQAYPSSFECEDTAFGTTYREWLIGQALAALAGDTGWCTLEIAPEIIAIADAIIAELDAEQKK